MTTTIRTGPRSTELDGLDEAIESHPIWTELRGPDTSGVNVSFQYNHTSTSVLGAGVSASGSAGTFSAGGTRTQTSTIDYTYPEVYGPGYRLGYTNFIYDKWFEQCRDTRGNGWSDWVFGVAHFQGGQTWTAGPRLGMGFCSARPANTYTHITSSTAYEGGADAATAGLISINLSARTGYSNTTDITFHFGAAHPLCGWKNYEGTGNPELFTTHNS